MVGAPSVHAEHIQRVHGVEGSPLPDFVAEADISIKLVPKLAQPYKVEYLLMQVDQVRVALEPVVEHMDASCGFRAVSSGYGTERKP